MGSQLLGGWTTYSCQITEDASKIFEEAFQGFVGVSYTPVAFATQLVSGTNYSFFCNAKAVYPNAPNQAAMVDIYQPLEGLPHITEITPIKN
jgi:hypothetical protein